MSAPRAGTSSTVVLRQGGAVLVPVAVWVGCVLAVADAVVEGTPGYAGRVALWAAAVALAAWLVLASPCLVVERDGLRVVNPLRIHWVPYAALEAVRVRGLTSLSVWSATGRARKITSWNAPGVPRRFVAATPPVAVVIERFRTNWELTTSGAAAPEVSATSWRWRPSAVLLALVAANIAIWLR